jgi:hypothetical protein
MAESDSDEEMDWGMVDTFVTHMLTNLGSLSVAQIHDQLTNFLAETYGRSSAELKSHLAVLVQEEKLLLADGLYSLPK